MSQNDIILIIIFSLILLGLIGFLVFILLKDKKDIKREEKFKSIKENSLLNDMDNKKDISSTNKIESVTKGEVASNFNSTVDNKTIEKANADEMKKPLTKEERERLINPFGVDMTRRGMTKEVDSNKKFFK